MVRSNRVSMEGIPKQFTLGTGHVKFFYNKLGYLHKRYHEIYNECIKRNLNVQYYGDAFNNISHNLMNEYEPSQNDRDLLIERILLRGFNLSIHTEHREIS